MTTPTNSALHMMEGQGLSDAQIVAIAAKAYAEGRMSWLGFEKDEDGIYNIPVLSGGHFQLVRAVLEAAPHKTALSHFADEVEASGEAEKHAVAYYNDNWTLTPRAYADAKKRDQSLFTDLKPAFAASDFDRLKALYEKSQELFARERGITKELAAALQDLLDFHTKPAGVDVATILDKAKFADVLAGIDKHSGALTEQARAALSKVQQP